MLTCLEVSAPVEFLLQVISSRMTDRLICTEPYWQGLREIDAVVKWEIRNEIRLAIEEVL